MALVPWRRRERRGLLDLQDRINTMFGELFRGSPVMPWGEEQLEWLPALNISETDEEVRVTAELPGVDPGNVDISLTEDMLTIRGEKKEEQEEKRRDYHRIERCYGSFSRTVSLPSAVDADTVEATFKDGVLTIAMPKREEARTRKVKVEVK
jgi:HSP20 family protein